MDLRTRFIHVPSSAHPYVRLMQPVFLGIFSLVFFEVLHRDRNLGTWKCGQKKPKWSFLEFDKILSLLFAASNLKCKTLQFSFSLCKPYKGKFSFSCYNQNALMKSACRISWSSISLEGIHGYLLFFTWKFLWALTDWK